VAGVSEEAPGVVSIELVGRRLERFPAEPGQYFRWRFLTRDHWMSARPYSLSRAPDGRRLRITATVHGRYSSRLLDLPLGTSALVEGPTGGLAVPQAWTGPVLLIGGGVGITPLRALLESCPGAPIVLVHRLRGEPLFTAELTSLAEARAVQVHRVVGPRAEVVFDGESIAELCGRLDHAWICVCGSAGFVRYVSSELLRCGARRRQLSTESFEMT
jgi:ferredoxin-NADP reductase